VGVIVIAVNEVGINSVVPAAFTVQVAVLAPELNRQRSVIPPMTSETVVGFTTAVTEER
jgi:hypothetical protein